MVEHVPLNEPTMNDLISGFCRQERDRRKIRQIKTKNMESSFKCFKLKV